MSRKPGEVNRAIKDGYRVTVHGTFFPYPEHGPDGGTIHAEVDHGARAVFCSQEFFEQLPKEKA